MTEYLFTSHRLGFRNWNTTDIQQLYDMCIDKDVMEFFPNIWSMNKTSDFVERMQQSFKENGYCYFAVEILDTQEFIGFIGLSLQTFEANFTPMTDIGWRLKKDVWGKGYATEGAHRCLKFGFEILNLKSIYATAPGINLKSQRVMEKIGMTKRSVFLHPKIEDGHVLKECFLFEINQIKTDI